MKLKGLFSFVSLASTCFFAGSAAAMILPPNDLHLQDVPGLAENMTEEEFNDIIDRVEDYYAPIIEEFGARLRISRRWEDTTVNAYAQQQGRTWIVTMFGGLARRPEVTPDGFMLVVCHEMGHHVGGFPFSSRWAANEGQSDYFATHACARNIWIDDTATNASFRDTVDETAKMKCDIAYNDIAEQNLCYRSAMAGKSLAVLLGALRNSEVPTFETPDESEVSRTNNAHPEAQCRLDTYFAGALCSDLEWDDLAIPGKSVRNSRQAEITSLKYSCSQKNPDHEISMRPKCWFAQKVEAE